MEIHRVCLPIPSLCGLKANCLTPVSKPRFQIQICSSYLVGLLPADAYEMQGPGLDVTDKHRVGLSLQCCPKFLTFPSLLSMRRNLPAVRTINQGRAGVEPRASGFQVQPPPRPHCLVSDKPLGPSELQVPSTSKASLLFLKHSCYACTQAAIEAEKGGPTVSAVGRRGLPG